MQGTDIDTIINQIVTITIIFLNRNKCKAFEETSYSKAYSMGGIIRTRSPAVVAVLWVSFLNAVQPIHQSQEDIGHTNGLPQYIVEFHWLKQLLSNRKSTRLNSS